MLRKQMPRGLGSTCFLLLSVLARDTREQMADIRAKRARLEIVDGSFGSLCTC